MKGRNNNPQKLKFLTEGPDLDLREVYRIQVSITVSQVT